VPPLTKKHMRRIVVCGSRNWTDGDLVWSVLEVLRHPVEIIHGDAPGADRIAAEIAEEQGFRVTAVPAEWDRYGRSAGMKRNVQMLEMNPSIVIAFWDGKSRGTAHTVREARKRGIPVLVVSSA
jgi:hypothetical protein